MNKLILPYQILLSGIALQLKANCAKILRKEVQDFLILNALV